MSSANRTEAWLALRPRVLWDQVLGLEGTEFKDVTFTDEWVHSRCVLPWPIPTLFLDVLRMADDAVIIAGGGVTGVYVELWNDGSAEIAGNVGFDAGMDPVPLERLARGLVRIARVPVDASSVLDTLGDASVSKGSEVTRALADQLGFYAFSNEDAWRHLGGCIRLQSAMLPDRFGIARIDWDAERFVLGRGVGFIGLWDRLAPAAPIRRWDEDDDTWFVAAREWLTEFVIAPILRSYRLDGVRAWAPAKAPFDPAVFYHYSPRAFEVFIARELPVTLNAASGGTVIVEDTLARSDTLHVASGVPNRGWAPVTLRGPDDARVLATAVARGALERDWANVPDEVSASLDTTSSWVSEHGIP